MQKDLLSDYGPYFMVVGSYYSCKPINPITVNNTDRSIDGRDETVRAYCVKMKEKRNARDRPVLRKRLHRNLRAGQSFNNNTP
jgi:hypothetical protein